MRRWRGAALVGGTAALLLAVLVAISVGTSDISLGDALQALWWKATGAELAADDRRMMTVVWSLRLPRIAMAIAAGAALSMAGVVMQGLLHNPLVSPFTLGISSAAAFGASVALVFGWSIGGNRQAMVVLCALVVALLCGAVALGLAATRQMSPTTVILVGLAFSYLFSALASVLQYIATTDQLSAIVHWTFGSVNGATWGQAVVVGIVTAVAMPLLLWRAGALNAIAFGGDDAAQALGVRVSRVRVAGSIVAIALAAVAVSFTGVIGFVGLVGPHIARMIIGADHRYVLPFSVITGALLLLVSDTIGRTIVSPSLIPVGIVVSFVGAPLFLNLVLARRKAFG